MIRSLSYYNTAADSDWQKDVVICMRSCQVGFVACTNKGATDLYLWICDSAVALRDGAGSKPNAVLYVPALTTQALDYRAGDPVGPNWGKRHKSGLYVCVSTAAVTKTAPATADAFFEACYLEDLA